VRCCLRLLCCRPGQPAACRQQTVLGCCAGAGGNLQLSSPVTGVVTDTHHLWSACAAVRAESAHRQHWQDGDKSWPGHMQSTVEYA
jgi:hypothetical protein